MIAVWIALAILVLLVLYVIVSYNSLVRVRNRTDDSWSQIDVQLRRRYDLIPNLVETVKGYAAHERQTLEEVTQARGAAIDAKGPRDQAAAEGALSQALGRLFAVSEAYPQLRAVESFTQLQGSLEEIETAVQNARRYYNAVVRDYNTKIEVFPTNLLAGAFGFTRREFFSLGNEEERDAPAVDFS